MNYFRNPAIPIKNGKTKKPSYTVHTDARG